MLDLSTQATLAYLASLLLQWLKAAPWLSIVSRATPKMNRAVSILLAGLTSLGVNLSVSGSADLGWQVLLQIPALGALLGALWLWLQQWILQQILFKTVVK